MRTGKYNFILLLSKLEKYFAKKELLIFQIWQPIFFFFQNQFNYFFNFLTLVLKNNGFQ